MVSGSVAEARVSGSTAIPTSGHKTQKHKYRADDFCLKELLVNYNESYSSADK